MRWLSAGQLACSETSNANTMASVATSLKGWVFVVNPASASGATGKKWPKMLQKFKDAASAKSWSDIEEVSVVMTTRPSEGNTAELCALSLCM